MILKTFLKKEGLVLSEKQQSHLGLNVSKSFFTRYPQMEIKKVQISTNGKKMLVFDYPRDFFEEECFKRILKRFTKKNQVKRIRIVK
jgi:hypothetical protein